jgi:hypothetical protein
MATRSDATLIPSNDTDAHFRAWAQFVEDTIVTTGGWVVTGDTGQTTIGTQTHPTLANEKRGYRVYRMADALQATSPVFMRIDYGSGSGANIPAVWITLGTGSNGTGTITGPGMAIIQFGANTSNNATATNSYGSASTNRFCVGMLTSGSNIGWFCVGVERTKDSNGLDTGDGLIVLGSLSSGGGAAGHSQFVNLLSVSQPAAETGWCYVLSGNNPSTFNSNVGVSLVIPFAGSALQPGMNFAVTRSSDFAGGATFSLTVYGNARTYQHLNTSGIAKPIQAVSDAVANRVCMRFD